MLTSVPLNTLDLAEGLLDRARLLWHWASLVRSILDNSAHFMRIIMRLTRTIVSIERHICRGMLALWVALVARTLLTLEHVAHVVFLQILRTLGSFRRSTRHGDLLLGATYLTRRPARLRQLLMHMLVICRSF